jgi:hypothetical protein
MQILQPGKAFETLESLFARFFTAIKLLRSALSSCRVQHELLNPTGAFWKPSLNKADIYKLNVERGNLRMFPECFLLVP